MTDLTCLPRSIFSWNYSVIDVDNNTKALVNFNFASEQGSIILDLNDYKIQHRWLSGEWLLKIDDEVVATAIKPNPLTRFFEVTYEDKIVILKAESPFSRTFLIEQNEILGVIEPTHLFTRRAAVNCSSSIRIPIQIFLFWLTVLMWRRAANTNN
ncbi:MAG: hypothetical protein AAGE84_09675 [Cyanobacteria bacterium P01_G01_bin.39]